jgi:hypothetical protein
MSELPLLCLQRWFRQPHCRSKVGLGGGPPVGSQILSCFSQFGWDVIANRPSGAAPPAPAAVVASLQKTSLAIASQLATPAPKPEPEPEPEPEPLAKEEGLFEEDDDWGGDDFAVRIHQHLSALLLSLLLTVFRQSCTAAQQVHCKQHEEVKPVCGVCIAG